MYQSQVYNNRPGCFGCFGYSNAPVVPQGYGYDQYNNPYNPYGNVGLATSVVAPVNVPGVPMMPPVAPMMNPMLGQVDSLYQSRTIQAPPVINKAVVNPPATTSRIQYVPYQVKQIVYDTVEKREVIPIHKTITQYEQIKHVETIPVQKMVTDYYAVEYMTEFMPQVVTDRVTDYVQQQVINQTVNYIPRQMQRVVPAGQYQMNQMVPPLQAPMMPQMPGTTFSQSIVSPNMMQPPMVASVATLPPSVTSVPLAGSFVSPGLNVSQQMMASTGNFGYGMGPTVGTVVGAMNQPAYGVTAMTY